MAATHSQVNRRTFLLTLSQADLQRWPDCESFSAMVLGAFAMVQSTREVKQWACCKEPHEDGGRHYHMAVNLSGARRWQPIKRCIFEQHGVSVNFSDTDSCGYVAAYRYVSKNKPLGEVLRSDNHPDLSVIGSPRTARAMATNHNNKRRSCSPQGSGGAKAIPKRLQNCDVASVLVANEIRTVDGLCALAKQRRDAGERDLNRFVLAKSPSGMSDLLDTTWRVENAEATLARRKTQSLDLVRETFQSGACVEGCQGSWLTKATEVLANNAIEVNFFSAAIRNALVKGRRKNTNILLTGPTNCGKSFLLDPLELIFSAFMNPATGRYAWIGMERCEVAYLNDFRWSPETIAWSDFLLLFEGQTVNLPRPKNQFATDLRVGRENTIPFFATSKGPIEFVGKFNVRDERETDMMSSRWFHIEFDRQIANVQHTEACPKCFASLIMTGS